MGVWSASEHVTEVTMPELDIRATPALELKVPEFWVPAFGELEMAATEIGAPELGTG